MTLHVGTPKDMRATVAHLHAQGLPDTAIATRLRLSVSNIGRIRARLGLERNPPPPAGRIFDEAEVLRRHQAGEVDRAIAAALNVSRETIQKFRAARNLAPNGWHAKTRQGKHR